MLSDLAHADAEAAEERVVATGDRADGTTEYFGEVRGDRIGVGRGKRTGVLDTGFAAGELATDVREIGAEERAELVGRAGLRERGEHGADQVGGDHAASRDMARRRLASARTEAADIGRKRA